MRQRIGRQRTVDDEGEVADKTLTDKEIEPISQKVVTPVAKQAGAVRQG